MANVANLRINAVVNDQASPALKRINGALNGLNSGMTGTSGGALGAARALTSVGSSGSMAAVGIGVAVAATAALVAGTVAVVKASVAAASEVEGYRNTLLRLTGDAAKADAMLAKLQDFADWSPFDDATVMQSAQRLLGAGVAAEDLTKVMTALSDVSGDSSETFLRASVAFSQMALKGKVSQEELNQFAEAGIPAQKMLADAMGVSTSALGEMISKGLVPANKALPLLVDAIGNKFGGATERASQSAKGLQSTLDAKMTRSFASLGKAIEPLTKDVLRGLTSLIDDLDKGIQAITSTPEFQDFLAAAGEAFKAILEVARPVMTLLFDLGRAVLPALTIVLKAFTLVMRLLGAGLQFVARLLKPVWDYIRALGNALKAGIDWVMAWGARIGEWPKLFGEARDWVVEFIGWIKKLAENPAITLKVLWDVAALTLPSFAPITINILWNVAKLVIPGLEYLEAVIKVLVDRTSVDESMDAIKARTTSLVEPSTPYVVKVLGDSTAVDESIDAIKARTTSLVEPTTPYTVTVGADTRDADYQVRTLGERIADVVNPLTPYVITIATALGSTMADIAMVASGLLPLKEAIRIAVSVDTTGVNEAISAVKSAQSIAVNQTGPGPSGLSVPPATMDLGSSEGTGPGPSGLSVPPAFFDFASIVEDAAAGAAAAAAIISGVGLAMSGFVGVPAGGGCFTGDTRVWTADGLRRISEIVIGDMVEVYDPETREVTMASVCETLVHQDHPLWHLRIYGDVVTTTAEHPFLTSEGWLRADELRTGTSVVTPSGLEVVEESYALGDTATVYNLHVDHPAHTYVVGTARWVVHNFKSAMDLADIGRGAVGGIVTKPTMALIGEAGPEALVPLNTMPGASPLGGLGGVNVDTVVINVSGFADGASAGRAAADAFRRQLGLQRRLPFGTA